MSEKKVLTMAFDDQKSLDKFMNFMDCYGEQVYWEWMEGADEYPSAWNMPEGFTFVEFRSE